MFMFIKVKWDSKLIEKKKKKAKMKAEKLWNSQMNVRFYHILLV